MHRVNAQRRDSIFDSRAESALFFELDSRWNPKLRLFAQTPLRSLFEIPGENVRSMQKRHLRFFRQATVDFTFIDNAGKPLLSIEFDGIGGGFGQGSRYVPARPTLDPNRKWKLDFKLRAAARAHYPLFVVSFEEIEPFEEEASVTIVDGIVGQLLSREHERQKFEQMIVEDEEYIDRLPRHEAHEHIEDLLLQASVLSDSEHDPLAIAIGKEVQDLLERFGLGAGEIQYPWMYDPPAPDTDGFPPSVEVLKERIAAFENARRVGARVGVPAGGSIDAGEVFHAEVWVRNIGKNHGLMPELIATQIAHLCALRKLRRATELGEVEAIA